MKKCVVLIGGGLGNQLFQYAFGYAMARRNNKKLILDPLFAGDRKYQLEFFEIDYRNHFIGFIEEFFLKKMNNYQRKHIRFTLLKISLFRYLNICEKLSYQFDKDIIKNIQGKKIYYEGFWQSWKYFDEYKEDIKRQFQYKQELSQTALEYKEKIQMSNSISIHIRRTDYLTTGDNYVVPKDYYYKALDKLGYDCTKHALFVFSDDKDYVNQEFGDLNFCLVNNIDDIEEFILMSACKHHIIANSTFSWWAAYLSSENGKVVAPIIGNWNKDFYLPEWITLDVGEMNEIVPYGRILKL